MTTTLRRQEPGFRRAAGRRPATGRRSAGKLVLFFLPAILLIMMAAGASGCAPGAPQNIDWAAPAGTEAGGGGESEIQQALDAYAEAIAGMDREKFLSMLDPQNQAFGEEQATLFDRLAEVPFAEYRITVTSQSEPSPGNAVAKVEIAYTYTGSFTGLPDPERAAFRLARRADGWKISGDATTDALGKPRDAGLESFGPVKVINGERVIVLYHPSLQSTAEEVARLAGAAFPRLESALPGVKLPKVPIKIFDTKEQIDTAFPGKWTEWTGGASRQMGSSADQGGEIIIDGGTFNTVNSYDPGYNSRMLAHELTHVALFPQSGPRTPPFLVEGLADYVAGEQDVSLLRQKMRSGESFSPSLRDLYQPAGFAALLTTEAATLAYEQADTAVALLEERYGHDRVLELIREFKRRGEEEDDQDRLVDGAFRAILGIGWDEFEAEWRRYVIGG